MKHEPKYVNVSMYDPGRALFLVALKTKNVPGALGDVATRIGKMGVNILSTSNYSLPDKPESMISFFAESKDATMTTDDINKAMMASPFVVDTYIKKGEASLLADDFSFPLMYFPAGRGILLPESGITAMFQDIIKLYGTGGESILFRAGYSVGRQGTDELVKLFGEGEMLKNPKAYADLYTALGWGRMEAEVAGSNKLETRFRLYDGFESSGVKTTKPNCHFLRGLMAGSSERLTGLSLNCTEEKCLATGDPYCEFALTAKSDSA